MSVDTLNTTTDSEMTEDEKLVREWWKDVRYKDGAVRIKHEDFEGGEWEIKPNIGFVYGRPGDNCQCYPIHRNLVDKDDENGAWRQAVKDTRNIIFYVMQAMNEKQLLLEVLRERRSKGIREIHDQTPIGRLLSRQDGIIYERSRCLKKQVTREELKQLFGHDEVDS